MKEFGKKLLLNILMIIGLYLIIWVGVSYYKDGTLAPNMNYLTDSTVVTISFIVIGFYVVFRMFKLMDGKPKKKKAIDKVQDEKGGDTKQFFSKDFLTDKDLNTAKGYNHHNLQTIRSCKKDGILVRAQDNGHNMDINFVQPIHAICIGTTSSGKTSRFVVPSIQLMSMTAAKPSFVITDPKGELRDLNTNKLREEGYDVRVLDLRDPFASVMWNPMSYPYDMFHRSYNLEKEVKVHQPGDDPRKYNLILQRQFDYSKESWFEFDGNAFIDREVLETRIRVLAKDLQGKTYTALEDICTTLAPIESAKDPTWEKTARRLLHAIMMAMLEDSLIPELGLTREKYNFYNVYKIVNTTDSGRDPFATLKKYLFSYRDQFSQVPTLASTALNNADSTVKNYMGFASSMVALFSDTGISFLTSQSEIDFVNLDEKPTAIFCLFPDEIRTRYPLAILFITQLYKRLVDKANSLGGSLKRHVYFLLDEFGNMPKFPEFGSSMAVGRSRGIFFELCVQSYSQLYQVYGQDEGKIIKDNCPIQIYIASEDTVTNKEFSELLGNKTISIKTENVSKGPDGKETKSSSEQVQSIPIAYPHELKTFKDQGLVAIQSFIPNDPLKTTCTRYFESKHYNTTKVFGSYVEKRLFDESAVFYDITKRNSFMDSKNATDEDEDDDDLF